MKNVTGIVNKIFWGVGVGVVEGRSGAFGKPNGSQLPSGSYYNWHTEFDMCSSMHVFILKKGQEKQITVHSYKLILVLNYFLYSLVLLTIIKHMTFRSTKCCTLC